MLPLATAELPIARYRFTARLRQNLRLPDYAGSLLRGQFGAALRHLACMTRQTVCGGCPLQASCPYTRIFEALPPQGHALQAFSAIPNAYVWSHHRPSPADTTMGQHTQAITQSVTTSFFTWCSPAPRWTSWPWLSTHGNAHWPMG